MRLLKLSFLLGLFLCTLAQAQVGSEFWFAAPDLSASHANNSIPLKLHISAIYETTVTISRPADPGFTPVEFNLGAQQTQEVRLDADASFNNLDLADIETYAYPPTDPNFIQNKGFLIEAYPGEVSVYYEPQGQNNSDFASLKAENGLGRDFWVSTQRRYANHDYSDTYSGFTVVATEDCQVEIDPKGNDLEYHGTAPFIVSLKKGEAFAVRAAGQAPELHIHGIHVTSTADIAIMIFDDSIEFLNSRKGWDLFLDQTVPTHITGLEYIVLKGETINDTTNDTDGEAIFITPTTDNTDIYINGILTASNLNAGDYFEYVINDTHLSTHVRATNPIYVNHICGYNNYLSSSDGGELGGAVLPPIDVCTGSSEVTVKRSPTSGFFFGINLMVRNDTTTGSKYKNQSIENFSYTINGSAHVSIPPEHFTYIMDSAFAVYDRYKAGGDAFFLNVVDGEIIKVSNTISRFHMGVILGKNTPGNKYGYFSDFGYSQASAGIGGFTQPPTGVFCNLDPIQLVAGGGVTYKWEARYEEDSALVKQLSNDTIPAPFFTPVTTGDFNFRVNITGECQTVDSLYLLVQTRENNESIFTVSADTGCSPFSPELTNLSDTLDGDQHIWTITPATGPSYQINQDTLSRSFELDLPTNNTDTSQTHRIELLVKGAFNTCPVTSTKDITVKSEIKAHFSASDTSGRDTLMVNFTNSSSGDLSGVSYYWDFDDGNSSTDESPSHFFSSPGSYQVELTAALGLECSNTYTKTIEVREELGANFSTYIDTVFCNPTGGLPPYSIQWVSGDTGLYYVAPTSGMYAASITDADGYTFTDSTELSIPELAFRAYHKDASCLSCSDGKAWVNIERANSPLTILWSNGAATDTIYNLAPGIYKATVSDESANTVTDSVIISTLPPFLSFANTNVNCHGDSTGTIDLTITEGSAPYTILWSNGLRDEDLSNLTAGTYTVTVTDAANQSVVDSVRITQNEKLDISAAIFDNSCQGDTSGSINTTITGGIAPYSYNWSNGDTTSSIDMLHAEVYLLQVSDIHSCSLDTTFTISQPDTLIVTETIIGTSSDSTDDGSISIDISGGVPPFTFSWSNGSTDKDISGLSADTYTLTISDSNACSFVFNYTVNTPLPNLKIQGTSTHITCYGLENGQISTDILGASHPVSFNWSTGDTTQNLSNLAAGTYQLIVSDAADKIDTADFEITEPDEITIFGDIHNGGCYTDDFASIELDITGGKAPYQYLWSTGATTNKIDKLTEGLYTVEINDANMCSKTWQGQIYGVGVSSLIGFVKHSESMLDGNADVYLVDASEKPHTIAHQARLSDDGYFEFIDIRKGFYLVYVKIDKDAKQNYESIISSYYNSSYEWNKAEIIYLPCGETKQVTVDLYENTKSKSAGSCSAHGTVIKDKGWVKANAERAANTTVVLIETTSGLPIDYTETDENGAYKFKDIPVGEYSIYVDIAGVEHKTTHNFTVDASSTIFKHLDFYADLASSLTIVKADFQLSLDGEFSDNNAVTVFPNPVTDIATLELSSLLNEQIEFALIASNGDIILFNKEFVYNGKAVIDLSTVSAGTYIALIKSSVGVFSKKIIKN